jgi:predicted nucleic acid-binding OB-fold protein
MWHIIDTREKKLFASFNDVHLRAGITSPAKTIAKRITEELTGESKYRLFVRAT